MSGIVDKYQSRRLTKKAFLERTLKTHGDRYDYSEVNFINTKDKVKINCKLHGVFLQAPRSHFTGQGCPKCNPTKTNTTQEFISKAIKTHGDNYNYSKVNYVNAFTKVIINCKIHGEFKQTPNAHLNGQGCKICGNISKTMTVQDFIDKSSNTHNGKYDYSKINYVNSYTKVTITCPLHGEFTQKPTAHLHGHGCYACGRETLRINKQNFIDKSNKIHSNKYDYSASEFTITRGSITIICPVHGKFKQNANNHLNGTGCVKCRNNTLRKTTEEFITEAKIIHGDIYDYSKVNYHKAHFKVLIKCPKKTHGEFAQTPHSHLKGAGCPVCSESKGELTIRNVLLKQNIKFEREYSLPEVNLKLRYDFFLPEYNLLIEFHGQQHYDYIPFFHPNGEDDLSRQKHRDILVRHLAADLKYNYLEFNYKQLDKLPKEQFEELILSNINKCKNKLVNYTKLQFQ